MSKRSFFDVLYTLALFAALFTIGYHGNTDESSSAPMEFSVTVRIEKLSDTLHPGSTLYIDGKYECYVTDCSDKEAILLCNGYRSDAGYLLFGSKYVSENQPIKASYQSLYLEGRIYKIQKHLS